MRVFGSVSGPSLMRPIAMPATGDLIGTPASIRRQRAAADARHRRAAVRLEDLADTMRIVYGNLSSSGIMRDERALGERAVADLAAARAAQRLRLARRERREVVVQHEALPALAGERVDLLLVARRAERRRRRRPASRRAGRAPSRGRAGGCPTSHTIGRIVFMSRPSMRLRSREHVLADDVVLALLELFLDELLDLGERLGADLRGERLDDLGLRRLVARRSAPSSP